MIRKFWRFIIVILIICSLLLLDNLESRAESIINNKTLDIQNSQTHVRSTEVDNYQNQRSRINNNDNYPVFESYYDIVGIDGFNKGRFAGHWVGKKIREYACEQFDFLECNTRSYIENE